MFPCFLFDSIELCLFEFECKQKHVYRFDCTFQYFVYRLIYCKRQNAIGCVPYRLIGKIEFVKRSLFK